jgi:hypothetical protein
VRSWVQGSEVTIEIRGFWVKGAGYGVRNPHIFDEL